MPKHADEMTPVKVRENRDDCVPHAATHRNDSEVFAQVIFRRAGCCKNQACGEGKRNSGGGYQGSGAPLLKYTQKRGHFCVSELALKIRLSGFSSKPERNVRANGWSER